LDLAPSEWHSRWYRAVVKVCPLWSEGTRATWERAVLSRPTKWEASASGVGRCVGVFGAVGVSHVVNVPIGGRNIRFN
jgi:hypothetical protein